MPRLSIIIPAFGDAARLENTLVSVLQNRPEDCEILVACTQPYSDPYQLAGEVRFLSVTGKAKSGRHSWVGCVNAALGHSTAPVVHVLCSGVEVTDGWTDAALLHFFNPRVAACSPLVRDASQPARILSAGLGYRAGGKREVFGTLPRQHSLHTAIGPTALAGFYRKSALVALGGLERWVGDSHADIDVALRLKHAGWQHALETKSEVFATESMLPRPCALRQGIAAQRLFLRNAPLVGWKAALAQHPLHVLGELVTSLVRPSNLLRLAGRALGCLPLGDYARHHQQLKTLVGQADTMQPAPKPRPHMRIDGSHFGVRGAAATTANVSRDAKTVAE